MEKLQVTNDYVFKKIFAKEGNENILKNLLISILEMPIEKIEVERDKHLEKVAMENKEGILDIKATLNKNVTVNIEMHFIQIPKFKDNKVKTKLDVWIKFIGNTEMGEEDMYELDEETKKALREAQKQYDDLNADPEVRRVAELRMKAIMDNATNMKGALKEQLSEIAKKMKEEEISIEQIIRITGLTKEEIENL